MWSSATECHRRGDLDNRHVFLRALQGGKPKFKLPDLISSEGWITDLHGAASPVSIVPERKRGKQRVGLASFYKGTDPGHEGPICIT